MAPPTAVLFAAAQVGASSRYRCAHAAEQLYLQGVPSGVFHVARAREIFRALAPGAVLVLHRVPLGPVVETLIAKAERVGAVPVFDFDDDVFRSPPDLDRRADPRRLLYADEIRRYRAAARRCRALLVATERLGRQTARIGRPWWVHRNAFSRRLRELSESAPADRKDGAVVIGYASGSATHDRDFGAVKPALLRILEAHPNVELRIVGPVSVGDDWGTSSPRVRRLPAVPWERLPAVLAGFDINLAPLDVGNAFAAAKSEVKYIEAALVGVPTVASPTEAFARAIRSGENGFLAGGTGEWTARLEALVNAPSLRRGLGDSARRDVLGNFAPELRGTELLRSLEQIAARCEMGRASGPAGPAPAAPSLSVPRPSLLARAWFTLRNRGAGVLIRQGLVRLSRLGARAPNP